MIFADNKFKQVIFGFIRSSGNHQLPSEIKVIDTCRWPFPGNGGTASTHVMIENINNAKRPDEQMCFNFIAIFDGLRYLPASS